MQSEPAILLNIFLPSVAGLVLILIDSRHMRNADDHARRFLTFAVHSTLAAMFSELVRDAAAGYGAAEGDVLPLAMNAVHIMARSLAIGFMILFLECTIAYNRSGSGKTRFFVHAFWVITAAMLAFSRFDDAPVAVQCLRALSVLLALASALLRQKEHINREMRVLAVISLLPVFVGELIDGFVDGACTDNSLLFVSMLFAYLFIVRRNTLIDALTGVFTRRACDERLLALGKGKRSRDCVFIMIDMNRFKEINDTFGHAQGDVALRDVAALLRSSVRGTDFVARYGGDEFVIIADGGDADAITARITESIGKFNAKNNRPLPLSLSSGSGVYRPDDARTPQEFLSVVDSLMYAQKTERRRTTR